VAQTYKNFEIIILDDGSSTATIQSFKDNLAPFLDSNFPSSENNAFKIILIVFRMEVFYNSKFIFRSSKEPLYPQNV
jgi:glycosyltransferase involved in cell wall biosynthesis